MSMRKLKKPNPLFHSMALVLLFKQNLFNRSKPITNLKKHGLQHTDRFSMDIMFAKNFHLFRQQLSKFLKLKA
jgi:hypothetical protein